MAAAYIRNRCYQQRTKQTAYFILTGRKPNLGNMYTFGSTCFIYDVKPKSKLDPRSREGVFIGYDRETPAYLIYFADSKQIVRRRCVKFINNSSRYSGWDDEDFPGDTIQIPHITVTNADDNIPEVVHVVPDVPEDVPGVPEGVPDVNNDVPGVPDVNKDVPGVPDVNKDITAIPDASNVPVVPVTVDVKAEVPDIDESVKDRPGRDRRRPKYLEDYTYYNFDCCCTFSNFIIPKTHTEALESSEALKWKQAMDEEVKSLEENETFDVVALPENSVPVDGRWVYSVKEGPNNNPLFKARYVAKGYAQVHGRDYFDTFAPTAKMTSVRAIMQIAAQYDLVVHQMDVKTAYLNAPIDCKIFLVQPEGYRVGDGNKILVWKLNKSIYGLKQSGKNWNDLIHKFYINNGFIRSAADPCVYFKTGSGELIIIIIWVDDIVLAATSIECMNKAKELLKGKFKMKDLGQISNFLGIRFVQKEAGILEMDQSKYLCNILEKFEMGQSKPRCTPCELNTSAFVSKKIPEQSPRKYREIVGSLIYAMTCTRPDLCWIVTKLSQHLDNPDTADWVMVDHVLRYIKGTLDYKMYFVKSKVNLKLEGFSDSDWGSSIIDRRSTSGFYFSLNPDGPPISWKTRKQPTVALSSCEAEYIALAAAVQEAMFLFSLLKEFISQSSIVIQVDNQGAIALSKNPIVQNRSKHIDIRYHFIREKVKNGFISLEYVPSECNVADLMTKSYSKIKLQRFKGMLFGAHK